MAHKFIQVRKARQHNLKAIDVDIPREQITVITGLSGSGKSSLAFDTIYAEGQRRYVESLSLRARQLLSQMPKPDVERIDGLIPTIAIEQRVSSNSPRSTVATTTEIYDFLRLLFARAGSPTCWICGRTITRQRTSQIVDAILALEQGTRFLVLAPLVRSEHESNKDVLQHLAMQGFVRARIDGEIVHLEDVADLDVHKAHAIEVIVDRMTAKPDAASRVADSIELALTIGHGRVIVSVETSSKQFDDRAYSTSFSCPDHPKVLLEDLTPRLFSFNSPHGACEKCHGLGTFLDFDEGLIVPDPSRSLADGAFEPLRPSGQRSAFTPKIINSFCEDFQVSPHTPFESIPTASKRILLHGGRGRDPSGKPVRFEGIVQHLRSRWEATESDSVKERLHSFMIEAPCDECHGQRVRQEARAVRIDGHNIAEICNRSIGEANALFDALEFTDELKPVVDPVLREIRTRLRFMCNVGVDYLTLDRGSSTLSGGEAQRLRLATQIGSGLSGVCYVLDEPTVGLHQRDSRRLVGTLEALAEQGNTVVVVEHDEELIAAANHVIDIGPGAGEDGGRIIAEGTLEDVLKSTESLSAQYFSGRRVIELPETRRRSSDPNRQIQITGARANNLQHIDVAIPLGCFVCVTGVSGSGKSTLVGDILLKTLLRSINRSGPKPGACDGVSNVSLVDRVIEIDQSPLGRSTRSNPATYVGVFDQVRRHFAQTREAKIRGYAQARFSFNISGGRCEDCKGHGTRRIEMHFLPDVYVECGTCAGTRYNRETLEVRYRGKNIADVLSMPVAEAAEFFRNIPKINQLVQALLDVGLGYLELGQASSTLSGGEAQRTRLAAELGKSPAGHTMYVLDEPTTGLHLADIDGLLQVFKRLVDASHSLVVVEHNLEVIKMADWVIDLGPEGGDEGGRLVAQGTPEEIAACGMSYTGKFLRSRLNGGPIIVPSQT
ncbi:MAG: excinuclease ABC subunit UvrA [Planctomycetes bacterium]|nr:excinuclease ABC subunit UvrA [Planctomycetota bacterium]